MSLRQRWFSTRQAAMQSVLIGAIVVGFIVAAVAWGIPAWKDWRASQLENVCLDLRDREEWDKLERTSAAWARSDPQRASAWLFRAEAAVGKQELSVAADYLFRVPRSDSRAIPAYLQGATILLGAANRPLEGIEALERLLEMEPRLAEAHKHLIQFSALTVQRQKLIQQVRRAIEVQREPPEAYVYLFLADSLRLNNGVEMNTRWLQPYPDRELFLVARAIQMDEVKVKTERDIETTLPDAKEANSLRERLLAELFRRFPQNVELLAIHAERALLAGETDKVVDLLVKAPAAIDADHRFWRFRGQIHEARGENEEAEAAFRKALELNRMDLSSMNRLAHVERLRGRLTEVERLQQLVRQADSLREEVRKYPTAEQVGPEWLRHLKEFAEAAGDSLVAEALDRRLSPSSPLSKQP